MGWLALILDFLLLGTTVAVLAWIYQRTRLAVVLVYLLYTVISRFAFVPATYAEEVIINGNVGQWLGATVGDRVAHYSLLTAMVGNTVQTFLFLWLVLSLVGWSRTNGLLSWRSKRSPDLLAPE